MGKYHNIHTIYNGIKYGSKAEAERALELDLMVRAGEILGWTRQVPFMLGVPENKYVVDFLVFWPSHAVCAEDVKGPETDKFKRDVKLWARYGLCPLRIIKRKGGRLVTDRIITKEPDDG